jgi:hypothetical protein
LPSSDFLNSARLMLIPPFERIGSGLQEFITPLRNSITLGKACFRLLSGNVEWTGGD